MGMEQQPSPRLHSSMAEVKFLLNIFMDTARAASMSIRKSFPAQLPNNLHFIGVCGRLVGGLALTLHKRGLRISGSDERQFPPMSELLENAGIDVGKAWHIDNLRSNLDGVVIGAGISQDNPELAEALSQGITVYSAAEFLEHHFLTVSQNLVVAGTKGKTSTTAMMAWIFQQVGMEADHLIGGQICVPHAADWPFIKLTDAKLRVLEGDEFPSGALDSTPKLLRYHPASLIIPSLSFDHPEVFADPASYMEVFSKAAALLPKNGHLIVNADAPGADIFAQQWAARRLRVGFQADAEYRITEYQPEDGGCAFRFGGVAVRLEVGGRMNARNAALAIAAAETCGVPRSEAAGALRKFPGVSGRLEMLAHDDHSFLYAEQSSHPAAVGTALETLREKHPGQRILAILFPYSTGGRGGHCETMFPQILETADAVILLPAAGDPEPPERAFDSEKMASILRSRGVAAKVATTLPQMLEMAQDSFCPGTVVVICKSMGPQIPEARLQNALFPSSSPERHG